METVRKGLRRALAGTLVCALFAAAAHAGLDRNPANDPRLLNKPIESLSYDRAEECRSSPRKGTLALQRWLQRKIRGESWGIMRCERLSPGNFSLHSEGRAIDWHLDASVGKDRRAAMGLIRTLLERDRRGEPAALARRMGVQGLIFNCRSWFSSGNRLGKYSYCFRRNGEKRRNLDRTQAHRDHIHIELNWAGARKRTSFWRSPLGR